MFKKKPKPSKRIEFDEEPEEEGIVEESEEEPEEEYEEEPEQKQSRKLPPLPPLPRKSEEKQEKPELTVKDILVNHEERLKNIEAGLFRLKNF